MVFEEIRVLKEDGRTMSDHLLPMLTGRMVDWRLHQPEVPSPVVHAKIEKTAVVVGIILNVLLAGLHDLPFGGGLASGDVACFGGRVDAGKKKEVRLAARFSDLDIEPRIF